MSTTHELTNAELWKEYEKGMNGQDWHIPEDESYSTERSTQAITPASTLPVVLASAQNNPDLFTLVSSKGGCSITYTPDELLPATTAFSHEMFDMTTHRCHGYAGRPKGDRGPSGEGWTGIYLRVDPIYDSADRKRLEAKPEAERGRGWSMGVEKDPVEGLKEGLVITGSDLGQAEGKVAAIYAVFLLTESMGLSPWYRWQGKRFPYLTDVAFRRHQRVAGTLPDLGQVLAMDTLSPEQWEAIAKGGGEWDEEERLDNLRWTALKLGKDAIAFSVMEYLKIPDGLSRARIEKTCGEVGLKVV